MDPSRCRRPDLGGEHDEEQHPGAPRVRFGAVVAGARHLVAFHVRCENLFSGHMRRTAQGMVEWSRRAHR